MHKVGLQFGLLKLAWPLEPNLVPLEQICFFWTQYEILCLLQQIWVLRRNLWLDAIWSLWQPLGAFWNLLGPVELFELSKPIWAIWSQSGPFGGLLEAIPGLFEAGKAGQ